MKEREPGQDERTKLWIKLTELKSERFSLEQKLEEKDGDERKETEEQINKLTEKIDKLDEEYRKHPDAIKDEEARQKDSS